MAISGHHSKASLRNYIGRPSSEKKRARSDILSNVLSGKSLQSLQPSFAALSSRAIFIFSEFSNVNIGSILSESADFFQAYEIYCSKGVNKHDTDINPALIKSFQSGSEIYFIYKTAASALLESVQKKTELLRIFLNVTCRENPKCCKMDLNSFILAPVHRNMK
ncbi:hypothetical protein pdam_00023912 [Pocillopora damicornis]|uniref:DH domain-containing protein n=1 Tax=Pocillopora damicornis TaxID=46731 RepID=A0A3M6TZF0_POCDA|nr:hypothetical protein pdam_00023912 [Pocillopora damicornis]